MKKNLKILGVEDTKEGRPRVTANGKAYARINTSDGWMSSFNIVATTALKGLIDQDVSVEVTEKGDFKNIDKVYGLAEGAVEEAPEEVPVVKPGLDVSQEYKDSWKKPKNGQASMYTSYAKDIFLGLVGDRELVGLNQEAIMLKAIELVKQAKEAFK